jgi:molybdopterin synthase sulfur carrier subunit
VITVRFFASFREKLDTRQLELALPEARCTVAGLVSQLIADRDEAWAEVLTSPNLLVAVNHVACDRQQVLEEGDEVAFYPPVTGG